jgi:argininosuccinate synthase
LFYLQADVGQEEDFEAAKKKAAKLGAIKVSLNSINTNRSYNECVHSH